VAGMDPRGARGVSFDVHVVTRAAPEQSALDEWAVRCGLSVEGSLDDAELRVVAPVLSATWSAVISVAYGSDLYQRAADLAVVLAKAGDGIAFEPQGYSVLWPEDMPQPRKPRPGSPLMHLLHRQFRRGGRSRRAE